MKVYIVSDGEYSDYAIQGIFSTEVVANAYKDACHPLGQVEAWDVDERAGASLRPCWKVMIQIDDGSVIETWSTQTEALGTERGGAFRFQAIGRCPVRVSALSYVSASHALKLAVEERQAWLREATERPPQPTSEQIASMVPPSEDCSVPTTS